MSARRPWRWALLVWAVLVVVAGGLTLWLQDSAEPQGPLGRQGASPTPSLPKGWESACAGATPDEEGRVLCIVMKR
ncbi:hypothetical protein RKD27_003271 [Streptomyces sp. SAI-126]|uniref:hypothetical protein n=1 Tax=unclassified Streptomyces TaxID=2593676 RepID=UPI00235B59AB|nr:hypothetical protein [Streptomyces sp. TUS-ST3]GLP72134.1 hypothetical protein TUSST3_87520 [Streptomyces sp. TUS-ST3]